MGWILERIVYGSGELLPEPGTPCRGGDCVEVSDGVWAGWCMPPVFLSFSWSEKGRDSCFYGSSRTTYSVNDIRGTSLFLEKMKRMLRALLGSLSQGV